MIVRHSYLNIIVTKLERKLAATEEFFIVPAFIVGIGDHPREPLGHEENVITAFAVIIREMLIPSAAAHGFLFDQIVRPVDFEAGTATRRQRTRQIDAHQRADNCVWQRVPACVGHAGNVIAVFIVRL